MIKLNPKKLPKELKQEAKLSWRKNNEVLAPTGAKVFFFSGNGKKGWRGGKNGSEQFWMRGFWGYGYMNDQRDITCYK